MTRIVLYVSGHGFGHASRDIELANTMAQRRPGLSIRVRTAVPRWLFDVGASKQVRVESVETDTGVAQIDSLRIDEGATVRRAAEFYACFDDRVEREAAWLHESRAALVVGDIPPLAFAAADRAGIPSVALGNFTWDWIYGAYDAFERDAPHVIQAIRRANVLATIALRLPLHGGFDGMRVRDIPFIARQSHRDPNETRAALGIPGDRPVILASFGGYGATLPVDRVASGDRLTIVETRVDHVAPRERVTAGGRLLRFGEHELYDRGFRYEDLVAAVDVVVTKPGYGIVSECAANGTALLYTSRGRFVEYDVFVAEMPRVVRCRYIPQHDLLAGRWSDAVDALLGEPSPPRPRIDGAEIAADQIESLIADR